MKGTIKWYNARKGYGFVRGEDEKEVFVHRSALPEGMTLNEGDQISYDVENSDKGLQAKNIQKL
jgi:CspA family cold shock protein